MRIATTIDWASKSASVAQRHTRYQTVCRFASYIRLEDSGHETPPPNHFGYRKTRRVPYIYSKVDIEHLVLAASHLVPAKSLRPVTYAALISLLAATGLRISEALAPACIRYNPAGPVDSQNQVPENSHGAAARDRRCGTAAISFESAENALQRGACVCLKSWRCHFATCKSKVRFARC